METSTAPDPRVPTDCSLAYLRRRAWAQSRDSIWQESEAGSCASQGAQENRKDEEAHGPSNKPGQVPNKITSWLIECGTPLGASLDEQSASPNRGAPRNCCSFEDDLSLGAEANHLHSSSNNTQSCFGLAVDQKRSQFKEKGRSMNSTGSGKSSTVSSVSELLDLYEEDPEEILFNLGFGREEPDLATRVPYRFINNVSSARGIDIKVYLGAQLQRMELENPNYALTSRFRQIEVLTTVANGFFQLYSQVSGQPVKCIIPGDQGGEAEEEGENEPSPLKRSSSALNVAKFLKKSITKHNLFAAASQLPEANTPSQQTQLNGHAPSDHANTSGHAPTSPEQDSCNTDPDHKAEAVNQKHARKKDSCSLATVTEETSGDGEADDSPEQDGVGTSANGEHQPESPDVQSANQSKSEGTKVVKEEEEEEQEDKKLTSSPKKVPLVLAPPQLTQLRNENADSFDMEEIQSNEDEAVTSRTSKTNDLFRTGSQQSDSSGFAEEPSADSNSYLKVQESVDSCDSETTVTSHPSQDIATPIALDQPVFDLPDKTEEETRPDYEVPETSSSQEEGDRDQTSELIPQYISHQLFFSRTIEMQKEETVEEETIDHVEQTDAQTEAEISKTLTTSKQEPQSEAQRTQDQSALTEDPRDSLSHTHTTADTKTPTGGALSENGSHKQHELLDSPSSPVYRALKRAKQFGLSRAGQWVEHQADDTPQTPQRGRGRGRGHGIPLQRSSSLPSSFLLPTRVVSSVSIKFGKGQVSCTQPSYSFKYTQESGETDGVEEEEKSSCLSTLVIKPASSGSHNQHMLPTEASVPPKPIPQNLMQSTRSLRSSSPLPDWLPGNRVQIGSTQSIPELSSSMSHFQNHREHQNQIVFPYPNPAVQYLNPSPVPSPNLNPSPHPFTLYPPPQYPSPFQSYASLPNLHNYNPSLHHHCSLSSLQQPITPTMSQHGSLTNFHQPSTFAPPHNVSLGNPHPGPPVFHPQSFNHLYGHQLPYPVMPHRLQVASPYLDLHGYNMNPNLAFPHPITQYPALAQEHSLHPGHIPPPPGFLPGLDSTFGPGQSIHQGRTSPALSSTEMQLRKVLHDIRGTVQSLNQNQSDAADEYNEYKATRPSPQSLSELQQRRQNLHLFRNQMMDLETSITRQQAFVYKHLSPADRLEVEHLQSLRSSVREELQELEQQLEDRLMALTHQTQYRGLHRGSSNESLSTAAALRAMEPVSDLLREQLLLQSEISCSRQSLSNNDSRSSSPVRGGGGGGGGGAHEQKRGIYRTTINITPVPPPRPNTYVEEEDGPRDTGGGEVGDKPLEVVAAGVGLGSLQDLIRQIRESVTQEVRREIYSELMATVSPCTTPLPSGQHPL
ncbi:protein ITPRID2 [Brachionichthys hirsutus]|uniref:protein ITPRID2 n=1 Tax=Brachionichthys hirsutus TaxID=412623 RepID=UPI003604F992